MPTKKHGDRPPQGICLRPLVERVMQARQQDMPEPRLMSIAERQHDFTYQWHRVAMLRGLLRRLPKSRPHLVSGTLNLTAPELATWSSLTSPARIPSATILTASPKPTTPTPATHPSTLMVTIA